MGCRVIAVRTAKLVHAARSASQDLAERKAMPVTAVSVALKASQDVMAPPAGMDAMVIAGLSAIVDQQVIAASLVCRESAVLLGVTVKTARQDAMAREASTAQLDRRGSPDQQVRKETVGRRASQGR